jgi:pyrrolidone-carboxylate peptidase
VNTVLVAGFGSFEGAVDNPSAAIAEALDGCIFGGVRVVGREMPVSFERSIEVCRLWIEATGAIALIGIGVAMSRSDVSVEKRGCCPQADGQLDVDHRAATPVGEDSPEEVWSTVDAARLAASLGAALSDDAGNYVCNHWLYRAVQDFDIPVGFIHVPPNGLDTGTLLRGIHEMWGESDGE